MKPLPALAFLSPLYLTGHLARLWLYRAGLRATRLVSVPVISVGNITTGGTGKSPMVAEIARILRDAGHRPGIASRGYGRAHPDSHVVTVCHTEITPAPLAATIGDEPALLARMLPGVPLAVHASRARAAQTLIEQFHCDVVILDDGFQHVQLVRNLDIVLLDATRPLNRERLLPAGHLRETASALGRAQVVVHTRVSGLGAVPTDQRGAVQRWAPDATEFAAAMPAARPVFLPARAEVVPAGARVLLAAGVGNPTALLEELREMRYDVAPYALPDHAEFDVGRCAAIEQEAAGRQCEAIVVTEKDLVKTPDEWQPSPPLAVVSQSVQVTPTEKFRDVILRAARTPKH